MPRRIGEDRLDAWRAFLRAHATVTAALEQELRAERDLPLAWYDVLVQLATAPEGRLQMKQLASGVMFSRSGLTRLVDRMAREGLVRRDACPADRRGTYGVITTAGRERLRAASGVHLRGVEQHFTAALGDDDVRALRRALGKVLARHDETLPGSG